MGPLADQLLKATAVTASWSGSDAGGIARYDVFERVGLTGSPTLVQFSPATSFSRTGTAGTTYCYRVTAVDQAGHEGQGEERCAVVPIDDRAPIITYAGTPTLARAAAGYKGTLTRLDSSGDSATLSFTGRKVGLLVQKTASSGKVRVLVDGVDRGLFDLYASSTKNLMYAFTALVAQGPHSITVRWTATKNPSSSGKVDALDGIAVIG